MGRIYKRSKGGNYYGEYRDASNKRHRISLRTQDRAVAKARLRAAELATTDLASNQGEVLSKAIDRLLTVHVANPRTNKAYAQKANHLVRLLGDGDINNLTADSVGQYVVTRREETASEPTIYKELVVLRGALKHASEAGFYHGRLEIIPRVNGRSEPGTRWLTTAELDKLLSVLSPVGQRWVMLCCFTGATSPSEVRRITWDDIHYQAPTAQHPGLCGRVRIRGTKRETRWRTVPLPVELWPWLKDAELPLRWDYLNALKAACKTLGIDKVTGNDMRRTYCSWMLQNGADMFTVSKLMGHSSIAMVQRVYGRLSEDTYKDAVARLPTMPRKLKVV